MVRVSTKEELQKAKDNNVEKIIVTGELAESLNKAKKIKTLGKAGMVALVAAVGSVATMPLTGGLSSIALAAEAAPLISAGITTEVIIAIVAVGGVTIVSAIFKDYNVKITHKDAMGRVTELELTKK